MKTEHNFNATVATSQLNGNYLIKIDRTHFDCWDDLQEGLEYESFPVGCRDIKVNLTWDIDAEMQWVFKYD